MQRYFIDTDDGRLFCPDEGGTKFDRVNDAEAMAVQSLSEIARDAARRGKPGQICARVRDEADDILLIVTLQVTVERPARAGRPRHAFRGPALD